MTHPHQRRTGHWMLAAVSGGLLVHASTVSADPPASTSLSNGASLDVEITAPFHDQEFQVPANQSAITVDASGTSSIGEGEPDATMIYVMDESGSTGNGGGTGCSPILDCEKNFFNALNGAAIADASADLAGVVHYSGGASIAQSLIDPANSAVTSAINAASAGGLTNCAAGLDRAFALATSGANTNGTTVVVFASDGECNTGGSVATAANALGGTGAIVHSVAIGTNSSCTSNGGTGRLNQIPQNGGSCTEVPDPGNLPNIIQNLIGSTLEGLAIAHDGGSYSAIDNSVISLPLPQPGSVSVSYGPTSVAGLAPATHELCVQATGSDSLGDVQNVADCHDIQLLQLTASPAHEANNLNFDASHTVTAEIVGGTGPARDIDFVVGGQNASVAAPADDSLLATPNASVDFTYSVPQDCASLGVDTIEVSTIIGGASDSIVVTKEWYDDVAPEVSCEESTNPHGNTPQAPGQGQNEDGFYEIVAEDPNLANCTVTIEVIDGDGYVFPGPFVPGTVIKYTQADGAPQKQKKMGSGNGMAGDVDYHLTGHGDLTIIGTDPSGNQATAECLVPSPPK